MVDYYARRAAEYERIYEKSERQSELCELRQFIESTFAGQHVLEIACGTGYWTEPLARTVASVVATDLNEEVLAIARSKPIDPKKAAFKSADAYALPIFPRRFTAGLAAFWWSHIPKPKIAGFLRQFHRAFAPGATLVFIDNVYVEGSSTPIARTDEEGNTYQIRYLEDGSTHEVLKNFPSAQELRSAVTQLATEVRIHFLRYYWILAYVLKETGR